MIVISRERKDMNKEEKEDYHWIEFEGYCYEVGISLEYKEDWKPWWDCWCRGIASERLSKG